MAQWQKIKIQRENDEIVDAQAPVIISASRSTDIPAFYADWFFHRLKVGYFAWTDPFYGVKSFVSLRAMPLHRVLVEKPRAAAHASR